MNFFKNIFSKGKKTKASSKTNLEEESDFMPKLESPTDNRFVKNFIQNGGKFLYSDNEKEVNENIALILNENSWDKSNLICIDKLFLKDLG